MGQNQSVITANWSSQPAVFHHNHGNYIRLSENNTVADWEQPSFLRYASGMVMTAEPVPIGMIFQVTVLGKRTLLQQLANYTELLVGGSLEVALTTVNPEKCTILKRLYDMHSQSQKRYWQLVGNEMKHNSQRKTVSINLDDLHVGQSVGLLATRDGNLHLFVDGKHREMVWSGLPTDQPLWGVADLNGKFAKIKADILCEVREELEVREEPEVREEQEVREETEAREQVRQHDTKVHQLQLSLQQTRQELSREREVSAQLRQQVAQNETIARQLSDTGQQIAELRQEKETQVHDLQQRLSEVTQQLSDVSREKDVQVQEKDAQIQHLLQRLSTTLSHTHSQEIEFWRVSAEEVQVDQRVLGRGAWGYVTRGSFRGQQVAVKKVYPDILKPHTVDRIRREISTMAQVRHPNLVLFIAAVLDDRTGPMIITEILDTSLRTAYEENRLSSNNKLRVFRDVASALNYLHLHREPIVHRDISTANVLLEAVANDMWKAKLSDFGSANLVRFATTPAEGAIIYTAPEAFPQHPDSPTPPPPQTPKIDVYSYGVLVGEVVTQELPDPSKLHEMVQQVWRQWPQIHPLVRASIKYSPDNRPTMAYILEELEKLTP